MASWKMTDAPAFSALLRFVRQLRTASDANASDTSALREELRELAEQTVQTLEEVDAALAELDRDKQDRGTAVSFTAPVDGWVSNGGESGYPYCCDLAVSGVTARDRADVTVSPSCMETAARCGLCPASETLAGIIRLRAAERPAAAITGEYWLSGGKE